MPDRLAIQFRIYFESHANPPGYKERFDETLRDQVILGSGFECYFGALGGSVCYYGVI